MAIIKCNTEEEANQQLLNAIQQCVDSNQSETLFSCGLSGGSLPKVLSLILPKVNTNWSKWRFFFCDERLVPFDDKESTFGLYKTQLLDKCPQISLDQFVTINESLSDELQAQDYESKMRQIFGDLKLPKFDLLLLGMGTDGHTCSLFPNHALIEEKDVWIAFITDSPKPPPKRITLTLPVINNSKCCIFYALGQQKAQVLKEIFVDKKPLPAGLVNNGNVIWILDKESGQLIPENMISKNLL